MNISHGMTIKRNVQKNIFYFRHASLIISNPFVEQITEWCAQSIFSSLSKYLKKHQQQQKPEHFDIRINYDFNQVYYISEIWREIEEKKRFALKGQSWHDFMLDTKNKSLLFRLIFPNLPFVLYIVQHQQRTLFFDIIKMLTNKGYCIQFHLETSDRLLKYLMYRLQVNWPSHLCFNLQRFVFVIVWIFKRFGDFRTRGSKIFFLQNQMVFSEWMEESISVKEATTLKFLNFPLMVWLIRGSVSWILSTKNDSVGFCSSQFRLNKKWCC